jgi:SEC-C motif-containing protein
MRSRYAAFALGLGDYLVSTLADAHEDRAHDPALLARELGRVRERQRFLGLRIIDAEQSGDRGCVLFHARIFERGRDVSFAELSDFVREHGAWRYLRGDLRTNADLPCAPEALTLDAFERG